MSIVNVALPSIGRGTGADTDQLQWVVSGYALAFGMVPIIAGRLRLSFTFSIADGPRPAPPGELDTTCP